MRLLSIDELRDLNKQFLNEYNEFEKPKLQKIATLKFFNDYDAYLVVCSLCNVRSKELADLKQDLIYTRSVLASQIDFSQNYEHTAEDYIHIASVMCKNLNRTNKYGLYEYEINSTSRMLINDLWSFKAKDCLKYVAVEDTRLVISIGKAQIYGFISALDALDIAYDMNDILEGLVYNNNSGNILVDYTKYTLPFTPYDFQIEDAKYLVSKKRALIGNEMGTGKTFISVLVGESINKPKLVICPESLRLNWEKEILQVDPDLDVQILYANEEYHTGKDWTIVGYITAVKYYEQLREFDCIFVDEVHNCKAVNNWGKPTSKRATAVINLTLPVTYCYLLSGTPVPSHNRDLFNILKMLKCQALDFNNTWAFKTFGTRYCDGKETYFGMDYSGNSNSDELHELLGSLMIRRLKRDVLPDLKKQRQFIPIEPKLSRAYKDIEKRLYHPAEGDTYMGLAMTGRKLLSELKLDTAIELAENFLNAEESVVIVTNFISTADALKEYFKDKACEIRGGMSDKDKDIAIKAFQSKAVPVCILNMQAGGVGITLTAASNMIMMDYAWVPADNLQTEDRICRSGQTKCCNIYYIYAVNSIFDKIFVNMISDKSANISLVVDDEETDYNLAEIKDNSSTYLDLLKAEIKKSAKAEKAKKKQGA